MTTFERYATENIAPKPRLARWCQFASTSLPRLAVCPRDPEIFSAELTRTTLGSFGVTWTKTTPAVASGCGMSGGPMAAARRRQFLVTLHQVGSSRLAQVGRAVELSCGDIVIRDLNRAWEMETTSHTSLISVRVPGDWLGECLGLIDSYLLAPLRASDRGTKLLAAIIEYISQCALDPPPGLAVEAIRELLSNALRASFGASLAASGMDDLSITQHIESRLSDPMLNIRGMALELNRSVRSIQRSFSHIGTTPRAYILGRRLALAAERIRLTDHNNGHLITEIAMECGFNDTAYFGRVFRQRFGMTPSQYRKCRRVASG